MITEKGPSVATLLSYWVRPYDQRLDRRVWRWRRPGPCHVVDITEHLLLAENVQLRAALDQCAQALAFSYGGVRPDQCHEPEDRAACTAMHEAYRVLRTVGLSTVRSTARENRAP